LTYVYFDTRWCYKRQSTYSLCIRCLSCDALRERPSGASEIGSLALFANSLKSVPIHCGRRQQNGSTGDFVACGTDRGHGDELHSEEAKSTNTYKSSLTPITCGGVFHAKSNYKVFH